MATLMVAIPKLPEELQTPLSAFRTISVDKARALLQMTQCSMVNHLSQCPDMIENQHMYVCMEGKRTVAF
jgi:hypothetical protein